MNLIKTNIKTNLIGQILADKYRLDELIQEGGIGQLYRATHVLMDKRVTVKVLNPALARDEKIVERFASEAKIASRLAHPNILNVTDYGTDKSGTVFLVMENIEGETLSQVIRREGVIALNRAVTIIQQISQALAAAHHIGINHLDLKSDNILLTRTAEGTDWAKVFNFSVAPTNDTKDFEANSAISEVVAGTPQYLAPEQCFDGEVDRRADVYSLGIIVYEMLTGKLPFEGATAQDIMLKQLESPPPALTESRPDLPVEIEYVLSRALAKKPVQRFQSTSDFADALTRAAAPKEEETIVRPREEIVAGNGLNANVQTAAKPEPPNNLWKTAFLVLAGISLMAAGLIYMTGQKSSALTTTPMTSDANSNPVQPANPPTGASEQNLAPLADANSNSAVPLATDPNGIPTGMPNGIPAGVPLGQAPSVNNGPSYNYPPPGVYQQQQPGTYTTVPNCGSEFMPCETSANIVTVPNPNSNQANRAPNAGNSNTALNANANRAKGANANSANAKPTTNANLGGAPPTVTKPANNANTAQPTATPAAPPETTKPQAKPTPKTAPKATPKTPAKPSAEKSQTIPESTGKQLDS